jgi:hypothetical protein
MNARSLGQRSDFRVEMFQEVVAHTALLSLVEFSSIRQVPFRGDDESDIHFA